MRSSRAAAETRAPRPATAAPLHGKRKRWCPPGKPAARSWGATDVLSGVARVASVGKDANPPDGRGDPVRGRRDPHGSRLDGPRGWRSAALLLIRGRRGIRHDPHQPTKETDMGEHTDKISGRVKQAVGVLTGDRDLKREGASQEHKGEVKGR